MIRPSSARHVASMVGTMRVAPLLRALRFASATKASERPICLSDRTTRKLIKRGVEVPVSGAFWDYVADEQSVTDAKTYSNNTENYIGTVKYPVGLMGPLKVNGEYAKRLYHVPMATHEGALLASYDRGAKAITEGGGVNVRIKQRCMLRAPVFLFRNIVDAADFHRFCLLPETRDTLSRVIADNIEHCRVTSLRFFQTDRKVHISIGVDPDDAAGQNMVTYAGDIVMKWMKEHYKRGRITDMYIEGGFNSGKRVSVLHSLLGKGHSVVADCIIPKDVVRTVLHTNPYELQRFQKLHNRTNEFIGGISCTAHAANGLAAFYIALGQDPACTAESQAAVTHFDLTDPKDPDNCGLYASITMNSIIVATIGGGTGLPAFQAARSMMDVKSANELAEICAGVVLAGELSFYAAMASGEFSSAHWNMTHKV